MPSNEKLDVEQSKEMPPNLHAEVEKLRVWLTLARNVGADEYEHWWRDDGVVGATQQFLAEVQPQDWSDENATDLLFILEQSSTDYIAELVTKTEPMALAIAKHSLARGGIAGDDIAEQLGHCSDRRREAEALLIAYTRNEHERTRRIALLSLARLQSPLVPALAMSAWDTGDEYKRMGALGALKTIGSELLPVYLSRAQEDGRENLASLARSYAEELATKIPPQ